MLNVDGCNGGTGKFIAPMRDCLETPVTYVASRRTVTEAQCTLFAAMFYGALLQQRGKGRTPQEHTARVAERAQRAYREATGSTCPFGAQDQEVRPSRRARVAFDL